MIASQPGLLLTLLAFAITIGILVFIHEMGHYLAGRWFGVKVERFSIGFGREVAGWTDKHGTRWKIGALPLGGYVQFAGDMDPSSRPDASWLALPAAERNRTFPSKPLWQRAVIVAAGPFTNFLFAIIILAGFALAYGQAITPTTVTQAVPGTAAQAMGLRAGDRILAVNGNAVDNFEEMATEISVHPGEQVTLDVERNGAVTEISGVLGARVEVDRFGNEYRFGMLGVPWPAPEIREVSLLEAPVIATQQTARIVRLITTTMGQVIMGRRSVKELGGPLKIAQVSGEQFHSGLRDFIAFLALISINLGFINLLPIPMLDGGHLLLYAIEAVRRRPANPQIVEWAFRTGVFAMLALMIFVTFNDLASFGLLPR